MRLNGLKAYLYGLNGLMQVVLLRFHEAETALTRGINICPSLSYNYGLRAYTRLCLDDLEGAVEDCSKKLILAPTDSGAYALRGWAHYLAGNFHLTVGDIEKSIELDPERRWYHFDCLRLIDSYKELGLNDQIISFCSATLKPRLQADFLCELLSRRANAYARVGDIDKAVMDYTRAIENASQPALIDLYMERSLLYDKRRDDDLAERDRMSASQLQAHKAQMSEWIPASPPQRLVAQIIDGLVVGCLSAFALFLVASACDIAVGGGGKDAVHFARFIPFIIASFALGICDSFLVCTGPTIFFFAMPLLLKQKEFGINFAALANPASDPERAILTAVLVVSLINWLYHAAMESSPKESTLGKAVFRLRVTDENGCRISFGKASLRHFLRIVPSFILVCGGLALFGLTISDESIVWKAFNAFAYILVVVLGVLAVGNPGLHNVFARCLVTDNHLYSPRLDLIAPIGPEQDGA